MKYMSSRPHFFLLAVENGNRRREA
ncbi:hypothetical protein B14911_21898 [Bacillus sp. NRRL B-14911]|nr:hypothetical protein B14911_21898 [Bacillus sp. NRRL B-14911]